MPRLSRLSRLSRLGPAGCLVALLCVGCHSAGAPGGPDLLTPEQRALVAAEADEGARGTAPLPVPEASGAGAPRIVVVAPDVSRPLTQPLRVELRFEPEPGATINPASFRVRYRTLFHDFDITERALKYMHVTATEVTADAVPLQASGRLTLVLEIEDSLRRVGRRELALQLGPG